MSIAEIKPHVLLIDDWTVIIDGIITYKKSDKYRGPRRCGWAGAVLAVPLSKVRFNILNNFYKMFFLVCWAKKIDIVRFRTSERMCVLSFIDLSLKITMLDNDNDADTTGTWGLNLLKL